MKFFLCQRFNQLLLEKKIVRDWSEFKKKLRNKQLYEAVYQVNQQHASLEL